MEESASRTKLSMRLFWKIVMEKLLLPPLWLFFPSPVGFSSTTYSFFPSPVARLPLSPVVSRPLPWARRSRFGLARRSPEAVIRPRERRGPNPADRETASPFVPHGAWEQGDFPGREAWEARARVLVEGDDDGVRHGVPSGGVVTDSMGCLQVGCPKSPHIRT